MRLLSLSFACLLCGMKGLENDMSLHHRDASWMLVLVANVALVQIEL